MDESLTRLNRIIKILESFGEDRLYWVEKVTDILNCPRKFIYYPNNLLNEKWLQSLGDFLMIHHAFSNEPFTKDKFEYAFVNIAQLVGIEAVSARRGNRGHDVVANNLNYSLKTQADKNIKPDIIWISKYMELGKGEWSDKPSQLNGLLEAFLEHLGKSEKILILRCLKKAPVWKYELVEIPKHVLERARYGKLEMMNDSKQHPKPGYCHVFSHLGDLDFQLYFDGGSERKLQIKALKKSLCNVICCWSFDQNFLENH